MCFWLLVPFSEKHVLQSFVSILWMSGYKLLANLCFQLGMTFCCCFKKVQRKSRDTGLGLWGLLCKLTMWICIYWKYQRYLQHIHSFFLSSKTVNNWKKRNYKVCYPILTVIIVRTAAKTTERKWVRFIICQHNLKNLYYACDNFQISWKCEGKSLSLTESRKRSIRRYPFWSLELLGFWCYLHYRF